MNKRVYFICIAAVCVFLSACNKNKSAGQQDKTIPVKVLEIAAMQTANRQNYVGTVEESTAVSLSFSLMGTVEEVFVQEGQRVQKGRLLATLNSATVQHVLDGSSAQLNKAQDAYNRLVKVHENGSLPDIKLVEVESGLQQAKSQVEIARKNVADCKLYAPRNGVIAKRGIEPGTNVMPGMEAFKLVTVETVFVKIAVPENEIGSIAEGQQATVTVSALDNAVFTGKIAMKGISANAISHTYEAKIEIANPQSTLMPGMICKVETSFVSSDTQTQKIVVPNRVIQISTDGKQYVWVADGGVAKRQWVETGDLTNNGIVATNGLSAGDKIITEGFLKISEGTKITITN
ncbi:MAG: efflux RND transporter periplasmic adaptor subunit [Dysgonamonadaceae bacterium]|jgi:RND family efflux transporter MFP subunit|nr:efflux RND transporter periplasmic adaptor subunit [Dysgonamonadaceae bacterium]